MFAECSGLTEWTIDLPAGLQNASSMFYNCTGLTSFTGALPASLTDAYWMFYGCTSLTEWTIDLPTGLQDASYMFYNCSLNETSILRILNTLPVYASGSHNINIGKNTKWASSSDVTALLGSTAAGNYTFNGWKVTV